MADLIIGNYDQRTADRYRLDPVEHANAVDAATAALAPHFSGDGVKAKAAARSAALSILLELHRLRGDFAEARHAMAPVRPLVRGVTT